MTQPLYFVEHKGRNIRGQWFLELDRDTNSRAAIVEMIRTGELNPVKVLEVCEDDGTVNDITGEIVVEARLPEIRQRFNTQYALDHARDYRKQEA